MNLKILWCLICFSPMECFTQGCNNRPHTPYDYVHFVHEDPGTNDTKTMVAFCTENSGLFCITKRFVCINGRWNESSPLSSNDCGIPPPIPNAQAFGRNTRELSHATYFCDSGFMTLDKTLTTCYKGQWNLFPLPTCTKPETGCGNPKVLAKAHIFGLKSKPPYLPSEKVSYECIEGFVLDPPNGGDNICLAGNIWSLQYFLKRFPQCRKDCGQPPEVANSSTKLVTTFVGSLAEYVCKRGLSTTDPTISMCEEDGTWNLTSLPRCIVPRTGCGNPRSINEEYILNSSPFQESENITYICNNGFKLVAPFGSNSTCTSGNVWSLETEDKFPYCQPDCSKVPPVPRGGEYVIDGKVISQDDSFGDEILISFACQKNYVMFTNATLHCKAGVWKWMKDGEETDPPSCGADCGPLPTVSNVSLHMTSTTEGSDAHYVCNTGFYTTDKSTAACRLDGKWSLNSPPLCLLPTQGCGNPTWLKNGKYNAGFDDKFRPLKPPFAEDKTVTYQCDNGYDIIAPNGTISTCQAGNMWSLKKLSPGFPKCGKQASPSCSGSIGVPSKLNCNYDSASLPFVENATIVLINETIISYGCDPGFITFDPTEFFCLQNATLELNLLPNCFVPAKGCGNPPRLCNGDFVGKPTYDDEETITYHCDEGFIPIAPDGLVNTCNGGNSWSQMPHSEGFPKCLSACNNLPSIPRGGKIVKYPVLSESEFYFSGSSLKFHCTASILSFVCSDGLWFPKYPSYLSCFNNINSLIYDLANGPLINVETKTGAANDVIGTNPNETFSSVNLTLYLCEFPGFCRLPRSEIIDECRNTTLISCDACGMVGAAVFLSFAVLLGLAILVGNALVIMVEVRRYRRNAINKIGICKCSLAVADILTGLQMLVLVVYNFSWTMNSTSYELIQEQLALRGSPVAYVFGCLFVFGVMSSLYHLVYMGGERLFAITKPLKYRWQSKNSVYLGLLIVWILSIISSTVLAWFADKFTFTYFASIFLYFPTLKDKASDTNFTASIIILVVFYVIPYLLMTASCIGSPILIFRNNKLMAKKQSDHSHQLATTARKRQLSVLKTVTIMQIGFTITIIPLVVVVALHYAHYFNCTQLALAHMITFYLSTANSFINVPIYSLRDKEFRHDIAKVFGRKKFKVQSHL
ncbi:sushi, von Willebrand factor type A, EGF and pentraxin domain-containing protein 1-like isoform X2 [Clavelina lepadiformis]|uniref:sushi, von Willebrand factor type A, EGF and pentraxin domain-containing protein 1-like isoform X2 n=1 Tax=Clavelina lepadiformis TaxID=159417 RepID=UPI00404256BA